MVSIQQQLFHRAPRGKHALPGRAPDSCAVASRRRKQSQHVGVARPPRLTAVNAVPLSQLQNEGWVEDRTMLDHKGPACRPPTVTQVVQHTKSRVELGAAARTNR